MHTPIIKDGEYAGRQYTLAVLDMQADNERNFNIDIVKFEIQDENRVFNLQ
jgi:hypothetical protein